ncbi:HTH-type transcriptional activator CmpR [Marinobacterium sp. xm-d-420]|nr:HTH-type transcriptional activator CmpR [Marinobacterium sp. xm-d-420]
MTLMFKNLPNIRHLRVFIEVSNAGGISLAAERVFLSQPAMTQAIAKLERLLGVKLFERQSSGMYLTEAGGVWEARVNSAFAILRLGLADALSSMSNRRMETIERIMTQLTTTQLKALVAVTDAQNYSVAGRNLGVSQSSLHRSARELESLMGLSLFEKTSTGIAATRAAKVFSKSTKLAISEIHQGLQELSGLGDGREVGRMRIGSMPLARTSLLPKAINEFTKAYPGITLELVDGPYEDLLAHILQGDVDLLVGALRFPIPTSDIVQEELIAPPLAIVARKGHPALNIDQITREDLLNYGWVIPRSGAPTRNLFEELILQGEEREGLSIVETSSHVLIRELLLGGDRLTLISQHQLEFELSKGDLAVLPFEMSGTKRPIGITRRSSWNPTNAQQKFIDLLRLAVS